MNRLTLFVVVFLVAVSAQNLSVNFTTHLAYGNYLPTDFLQKAKEPTPQISSSFDTLSIVGDVLLARNVETLMNKNGDDYPFTGFTFASTSYVLGNFEASVPKVHQPTPNFGFTFSVKQSALEALSDAGFTHLGLANNHTYDFEPGGFKNTKQTLTEAGLVAFGDQSESATSSVAYVTIDNTKIALVAIYAVNRRPDPEALSLIMAKATAQSDYQIAYLHWGTEYTIKPDKLQRELALKLVGLGADLIVGHHPHVVQSVELIDQVPVFYSLGNYVFDQYFDENVQTGLRLDVTATTTGLSIELIPVSSLKKLSVPEPMTPSDKKQFYKNLAKISDPNLETGILSGKLIINP